MAFRSWAFRLISLSLFGFSIGSPVEVFAQLPFFGLFSQTQATCKATCPGGGSDKVVVDVAGKCMCVGDDCFNVDIGIDGPGMTANGAPKAVLEGCQGDQYKEQHPTTDKYDNDCMKMGIAGNDIAGKWIHKTQGCHEPAGDNATLGCIAVPCSHWKNLVEKAKGKMSVVVCNGSSLGDNGKGGRSGEEWSETGKTNGGRK